MRRLMCVTPLFPSDEKPFYCIYLYQQLYALRECGYFVDVVIPANDLENGVIESYTYRDLPVIKIGVKSRRYLKIFETFSQKTISSVKQLFADRTYDIVAFNLCSMSVVKMFIDCVPETVPIALHLHGLNVWRDYFVIHPLYMRLIFLRKLKLYKRFDGIIGVSQKVCSKAEEYLSGDKIYRVYNGVDTDMFRPSAKVERETFRILCVANLIPIKGHEYLLNGLAQACKKLPETSLHLTIAGDGYLMESLKSRVNELGLCKNVEFTGNLPYEQIAKIMSEETDFFIMPSFFEALGCVYLEAMACGVPVLGVRGCGIDEVVKDRQNGYLVDQRNENQICDCIIEAVTNPSKHKEIAEAGYNTVVSEFTWKYSAESLAKAYEKIIGEKQ